MIYTFPAEFTQTEIDEIDRVVIELINAGWFKEMRQQDVFYVVESTVQVLLSSNLRKLIGESTLRSYRQEVDAAKEYLRTLKESDSSPESIKEVKDRLDVLLRTYAHNTAYQGFLELETEKKLAGL